MVFDAMRAHSPISRAEIARLTSISAPTVSAIVNDLVAEGFVRELPPEISEGAKSDGGRPPRLLAFSEDIGYLGCDLSASDVMRVGLVYLGVLSGLSTVVQLKAPTAYRGRILAFFLVALGVAYPVGSLVQGPIIDRIGIGWTTAGGAALLSLIMVVVTFARPAFARAITGGPDHESAAAAEPGGLPADEPGGLPAD